MAKPALQIVIPISSEQFFYNPAMELQARQSLPKMSVPLKCQDPFQHSTLRHCVKSKGACDNPPDRPTVVLLQPQRN